jgi:hypothetical protein
MGRAFDDSLHEAVLLQPELEGLLGVEGSDFRTEGRDEFPMYGIFTLVHYPVLPGMEMTEPFQGEGLVDRGDEKVVLQVGCAPLALRVLSSFIASKSSGSCPTPQGLARGKFQSSDSLIAYLSQIHMRGYWPE